MEPAHHFIADQDDTESLSDTWQRATLGWEPSLLRY